MSGIGDFDAEQVKIRLRMLFDHSYAHSIYGSTVWRVSHKPRAHPSHQSVALCIAVKCADAAAELAAKEAEYEVLLEVKKQKERIQHFEEQQKTDLDA